MVPKIEWMVEAARNRVFYDPATKELLIFSKKTWKDLPVEKYAHCYDKPAGWRYRWHRWWHGESVARFFWRNRKGYSHLTPNAQWKIRERA